MANLRVVLPGDEVAISSLSVGPGLHVLEEEDYSSASVSTAGLIRGEGSNKIAWVDYSAKRVSVFLSFLWCKVIKKISKKIATVCAGKSVRSVAY